ncbi:excitatory amino acid transporter 3-like [Actinia tenebrosa]|uniref:Amino acid transporter n=1 Tax=Actinia tenebrosa TaxID=6105 RepID=A0A6P8HPT8_ACTTE|nr:excitatory amino acid transporter 3-like [Actinia tenebrosa]
MADSSTASKVKKGFLRRQGNGNFCTSCLRAFFRRVRSDLMLTLILIGVVIGFIIGALINGTVNDITDIEKKTTVIMLVGFPGELFMNMLKLLILPLIVASLVTAVASLDAEATAKIGRRTITYYLSTTFMAVVLGIVLVTSIKPGEGGKPVTDIVKEVPKFRNVDSFLDLIRNLFPPNIAEATFNQRQTRYANLPAKYRVFNKTVESTTQLNTTDGILAEFNVNATHKIVTVKHMVRKAYDQIPNGTLPVHGSSMNVLGLVLFSIVMGAMLSKMGEKGLPLKTFFEALNDVVMRMVILVMWYSPIGICSLIASKVAGMGDILFSLKLLGMFMLTSILGILLHTFVTLPLVYFIFTRNNPFKFMAKMRDALITVWGTASSAATLPTTIRCTEENLGIDPRITRFVLPLGATVNMDGTALYEGVGAIWIAQINNIPLSIGQIITTSITATAAAIGAAAVPSAGLITMVIVCQAINVPPDDIGLIFAVDWFIDRFRGLPNIMGDAYGCGIVEKLSTHELKKEASPDVEKQDDEELKSLDNNSSPSDGDEESVF